TRAFVPARRSRQYTCIVRAVLKMPPPTTFVAMVAKAKNRPLVLMTKEKVALSNVERPSGATVISSVLALRRSRQKTSEPVPLRSVSGTRLVAVATKPTKRPSVLRVRFLDGKELMDRSAAFVPL